MIPDLPRRISVGDTLVESLLLLKRVHAAPKAFVSNGAETPCSCQTLERLDEQLFTFFHPGKDFLVENKEAAIHPNIGLANRRKCAHAAAGVGCDRMERLG